MIAWNFYLFVWSPPCENASKCPKKSLRKKRKRNAWNYFQWQRLFWVYCDDEVLWWSVMFNWSSYWSQTGDDLAPNEKKEEKKKNFRKQAASWVSIVWWLPLRRTSPSAFPFHTRLSAFPPTIRFLPLIWNCFDIVKWNLCLFNTWVNRCQANTQLDPPVPRELSHK